MILLSLSSSAFGMVARTDRKNVKMGWESKLKPAWVVDFHTRIIIYWRERAWRRKELRFYFEVSQEETTSILCVLVQVVVPYFLSMPTLWQQFFSAWLNHQNTKKNPLFSRHQKQFEYRKLYPRKRNAKKLCKRIPYSFGPFSKVNVCKT